MVASLIRADRRSDGRKEANRILGLWFRASLNDNIE
jgi:hypothetical protein